MRYTSKIRRDRSNLVKCSLALAFSLFQVSILFSQKLVYDNFDGTKAIHYGEHTGVLDTMAKNPSIDNVNKSHKCALYIRNAAKKFDNIKMELPGKLSGVSEYATYIGVPAKLKMKIYTNAPAGTLVEILLGSRSGNNDYPAGTNSQYQVYTTMSNAWEELEFKFSQIPQGSETSFSQIDQVTLLFNPNSSTSNTYYFDEITGPAIINSKGDEPTSPDEITKKPEGAKKTEGIKKPESDKKGNTKKIADKN